MLLSQSSTAPIWSTETIAVPSTSGNVLTSDGTNWTSAAPAAGSLPIVVTSATDMITGRISTSISGGSVSFSTNGLDMNTSAATTSYAIGNWSMMNTNGQLFNRNPTWSTCITFMTIPASDNPEGFIGLGDPGVGSLPGNLTFTNKTMGFYFKKESGSYNMYGTCGDGTTNTKSSVILSGIASADVLDLICVVVSGTSASFYARKNGGALSSAFTVTGSITAATDATTSLIYWVINNKNTATSHALRIHQASYIR